MDSSEDESKLIPIDSLGLLETSAPQSPSPNLTRTSNTPPSLTPAPTTPSKTIPFPTMSISPSVPVTHPISAMGTISAAEEVGAGEGSSQSGRARRELSVIEERDASSIFVREGESVLHKEEDGDGISSSKTLKCAKDRETEGEDEAEARLMVEPPGSMSSELTIQEGSHSRVTSLQSTETVNRVVVAA